MSHPLCFSIHEIREWLAAGPPYPLDPSRDLVYPSAGYVDSGNIKTTRDPLALPDSMKLAPDTLPWVLSCADIKTELGC